MKRPFAPVVSFYAVGLLLAAFFKPPLAALFAASFLVLILVLAVRKFRPFLLCVLLVMAGWTNLVFHTAIISPNDLRRLVGDVTQIATVRGTLIQTPQIKISEHNGDEKEHSLAQMRVKEILMGEGWRPAEGELVVT